MLTTGTRTAAAGRAGRQLPDGGRGWKSDRSDRVLEEVLTFPVFSPRGVQEERRKSSLGARVPARNRAALKGAVFLLWLWQILHHPTQAGSGRVLCVLSWREAISAFLKSSS